jgi:hypothetical protein
MRSHTAYVLLFLTSCAATELPTTSDAAGAAGESSANGGGGKQATAGGSGGGSPVSCSIPMDGPCPDGCCPLVGELFEVPSDRSCRRTITSGTIGCFEVGFAGCGGGGLTICRIARPADDGWEVIQSPNYPTGWSSRDGWSECNASTIGAYEDTECP